MTGEIQTGYAANGPGALQPQTWPSFSQSFTDYPEMPAYSQKPASSRRLGRKGGTATGKSPTGSWRTEWDRCPLPIMTQADRYFVHLPIMGEPSESAVVAEGTKRANPSRPSVSLPVTIGELRDLPRMLLSKSRRKYKSSNSVIESQFGWEPMISDITKLFALPEAIEKNINTIKALQDRPQTRRRSIEGGQASMLSSATSLTGMYGSVHYELNVQTMVDHIVTTRWEPTDFTKSLQTNEEVAHAAMVAALGLYPGQMIAAAWDLLPWSWLIDWFSNLGDILEGRTGTLAVQSGPGVISTVRTTTWSTSVVEAPPWASVTPGLITLREWQRRLTFPSLSFSVPLLSHRQTLILSSIAFNIGSNRY